ncbi:MAG: hypothetical protein HYT90_03740 [Candidatus Omnitrophica bacterium]|nr:hypothetical protein [Candidatus Omnitrophota bacterium]
MLNPRDRRFLQTVDRLKIYLILMAVGVFLYLLLVPAPELQMATSVLGVALCGVFWLTQRLLSFITALDLELTRVVNAVKRTLTDAQKKELFPDS